ncbi:MAG TPA: TRAP transporter small permease subunit [Hyphomicrobiaceae bacterium]|nr:TRAP transporter small permease subunit [Hyphomicrobiaceae bacterium]
MRSLLAMSRAIDSVNEWIGRSAAWLVLAAVLVSAANAIIRKAFDMSSNAWLELQWYLFGGTFMLAAAWTLRRNEHVRIDVAVSFLSKRARSWIDLLAHIVFLVPFIALMVWLCWPYAILSFQQQEVSSNAGGLIIWPAKALILFGFIMMLAQSFSEIVKRIAVLRGLISDPYDEGKVDAEAELAEALRKEAMAKEQAAS